MAGTTFNICLNAIHAGSTAENPEKWKVTQEMLVREIQRVKSAKREHTDQHGNAQRRIGFQQTVGAEAQHDSTLKANGADFTVRSVFNR